ncbi:DNA polymerase III subunit beta [Candidatus Liberibacter solanacearum CLso-ZC1]|uniref:Beta sliding clamp n=1 Tax=Liberibacter solanacearum (strain CLso-ZC1) TaxID=658172 RepID=E4UCK9_LIBSC|nr:DNA polymerase III subunit beta [Candidatus Liberibacter solanacearum]ADR52099.1 DNA polymerase III subunit beta [Candidatus Liberibacter solanacearum CLso-ZC1]
MEIIVERSNILEPLNHVCRIIERRTTIPVACHVFLQTIDGSLKMKASGPEIEITEVIPAVINVGGSATVSAHLLYDIVRKFPEGSEILFSKSDAQGTEVKVVSGDSQFYLQSFSESEFPNIKEEDYEYSFELESSVLKILIERTHFAMATEEIRYYLNGIFFHINEEDSTLCAVATDGHRLAVAKVNVPIAKMPSIIVPRKAVGEIQKIISTVKFLSVKISISESRIHLNIGRLSMSIRLIDGEFPHYQNVIPHNNDKVLRVNCSSLRQAVDRVSTISSVRNQAVKLSLSSEKLCMTVDNPEMGKAIEYLDVNYHDCPMDICFNYKYLLEIIGNISDDDVVFRLDSSSSSALIQGFENKDAFYVLMPMRI